MYTTLFFDLDGTLTDSRFGIVESVRYALQKAGYDAPPHDALNWVVGPPLRESFLKLADSDDLAIAEHLLVLYRERFEPIGMYENRVYDDIPELLDQLQQLGFQMFVATSKPRVYAEKIIAHFQLDGYFTYVAGAELDGSIDHKQDVIQSLLEKHPQHPSHCLMIGDRKHDIFGAQAHGIDALGVTYGFGPEAELQAAGAKYIVHSPNDILSIVNVRRTGSI